jgi:hypothetical protein
MSCAAVKHEDRSEAMRIAAWYYLRVASVAIALALPSKPKARFVDVERSILGMFEKNAPADVVGWFLASEWQGDFIPDILWELELMGWLPELPLGTRPNGKLP